jgi:hypothetical protein
MQWFSIVTPCEAEVVDASEANTPWLKGMKKFENEFSIEKDKVFDAIAFYDEGCRMCQLGVRQLIQDNNNTMLGKMILRDKERVREQIHTACGA